jgi:hypothetical protein
MLHGFQPWLTGAALTGFIWSKMERVFARCGLCEGKGITMEEEIGKTAGAIWDVLNTRGEQYLSELKKAVKGKEPTFALAIEWLARENQIVITPEKRSFRIRLKQEHAKTTGAS